MCPDRLLDRFVSVVTGNEFQAFINGFAQRMCSELGSGYSRNLREPALVQLIQRIVYSLKGHRATGTNFSLVIKTMFVHGWTSQVEFSYLNQRARRELGDLIFLVSLVFDARTRFRKLFITQFKKDSGKWGGSWHLGTQSDKEQRYLLSRLPTLRGVPGPAVPSTDYSLPNYSGCLTSYGLLYVPGDFALASATELDSYLVNRNNMTLPELYHLRPYLRSYPISGLRFPYSQIAPLLHFVRGLGFHVSRDIFGNHQHAYNAFDFARKYLTMGIGEPVIAQVGITNLQARLFLADMLQALRTKLDRTRSSEILDFFADLPEYDREETEFDGGYEKRASEYPEDRGIGLIHAILKIGRE